MFSHMVMFMSINDSYKVNICNLNVLAEYETDKIW